MLLVARARLSALIWGMTHLHSFSLRRRAIARALAATLAIAACSSGDKTVDPTMTEGRSDSTTNATTAAPTIASGSTTTIATTTTATQEAALRSAVRAFWDLYLELGARTGPFDGDETRQRLAERTSGAELNRLLAYFSSNAASGYVVRGGIDIAPTVVSVSGDTAQVRDCYDDTTGLYRISDDSRVDTDNPLRHQVLMTFLREGGVWKVSAISDEEDGCGE
jgi:hypothetical protein